MNLDAGDLLLAGQWAVGIGMLAGLAWLLVASVVTDMRQESETEEELEAGAALLRDLARRHRLDVTGSEADVR